MKPGGPRRATSTIAGWVRRAALPRRTQAEYVAPRYLERRLDTSGRAASTGWLPR